MHALNGKWTYHNSYLEILAMSGIIGLSLFLIFIVLLIRKLSKNITLLLLIFPLLVFSMGSFAIRNIEFWVIISIAYSMINIDESQEESMNDK